MEIRYERRFTRDLRRVRSDRELRRLNRKIAEIERASSLFEVSNVAKLAGSENHYRIKLGDYRLGIELDGQTAILQRYGHRRDFYRGFP